MLPAPKIVKAESNRTDLHAKIAEPPPIFYKDSEKNTPCLKGYLLFFHQCHFKCLFLVACLDVRLKIERVGIDA